MAKAEKRAEKEGKVFRDGANPAVPEELFSPGSENNLYRARNLWIPIVVLVLMMPVGLYITGDGNLANGSGSTSTFWAVFIAIIAVALLSVSQKLLSVKEVVNLSMKGMGGLLPLSLLMVLAFAIGATCKNLGSGIYIAESTKTWLTPELLPGVLFLVSCFAAFSTGTSWGTFAIMLPLAIPVVTATDGNMSLAVAAVLGGGIFGDHCSPISDTTLISSMSAACDHIDHVKTQLPYALSAAAVTFVLYLVCGLYLV